jgi:hypothetical protein
MYTGCPGRNVKKLRESVPYVKIYRYNPKHLYPKLNGYGDKGQRKVWSTSGFHRLYLPADSVSMPVLQCGIILHLTLSLSLTCIPSC